MYTSPAATSAPTFAVGAPIAILFETESIATAAPNPVPEAADGMGISISSIQAPPANPNT
jgi:hypothetical protein